MSTTNGKLEAGDDIAESHDGKRNGKTKPPQILLRACYSNYSDKATPSSMIHIRAVNDYAAITHCGLSVRNDLPFLLLDSWLTGWDYFDVWCPKCQKRVVKFLKEGK